MADLAARFIGFGSQVVLALLIFGLGLYAANLARSVILGLGGRMAAMGAQAARIGILVLTTAMALRELGIANEIVSLAFGLLLGAIAVAAALAFGLGSRDLAARQVERWLQSFGGADAPGGGSPGE